VDNRGVIVDCVVYEQGRRRAGKLALEDAHEAAEEEGAFVWIGLLEPTPEEFESVRREFDLHELAVEDAIEAHQRPKLEVYGELLFLVIKTARWNAEPAAIEFGEILAFVGDDYLITARHGEPDLQEVRQELEERPDFLRLGPAAALHAVVDRVVDDYEPVLEQLDAEISDAEAQVFSPSRASEAERIYGIKRQVLSLQGAVAPLVEPLEDLAAGRHHQIPEQLRSYFRDVYDHLQRMAGHVESYRELLTNVLTANLTQVSLRQNEDVRKISAWAAIIAVPTLIASVYGMNFHHMPELKWTLGYPGAVGLMALVGLVLYRYFHKVGWL
jgi:magnesium transporter